MQRLSICIAATILLTATTLLTAADAVIEPSTDYAPEEVVRIVINALKENDAAKGDTGIATVFRFASPGNRSSTGPLERFTRMIKLGFGDMLNHVDSRYDEMDIRDDVAVQAVWLTLSDGKQIGYAFQLAKQSTGEYKDMWMTDSVIPLGRRKGSGQSI